MAPKVPPKNKPKLTTLNKKSKTSNAEKNDAQKNKIQSEVHIEVTNPLTAEILTTGKMRKSIALRYLFENICSMCKMSPDDSGLIYEGKRLDLEDEDLRPLSHLDNDSTAKFQLLKTVRKITNIHEMVRVFERHK